MNRFLLFGGYSYYPCGGADDFIESFETLEDAEKEGLRRKNIKEYPTGSINWYNILDSETGQNYDS